MWLWCYLWAGHTIPKATNGEWRHALRKPLGLRWRDAHKHRRLSVFFPTIMKMGWCRCGGKRSYYTKKIYIGSCPRKHRMVQEERRKNKVIPRKHNYGLGAYMVLIICVLVYHTTSYTQCWCITQHLILNLTPCTVFFHSFEIIRCEVVQVEHASKQWEIKWWLLLCYIVNAVGY
jgi:hypothetical protein